MDAAGCPGVGVESGGGTPQIPDNWKWTNIGIRDRVFGNKVSSSNCTDRKWDNLVVQIPDKLTSAPIEQPSMY